MTPGTLSGFPDMAPWLERIRAIAAMPEPEALEATDSLLWSACEEGGAAEAEGQWDDALVGEQLARVAHTVARLREALAEHPADLTRADAAHLVREAAAIGQHAGPVAREGHAAAIVAARAEARAVAAEVDRCCLAREVTEAGSVVLRNRGSVTAVLATVDRALGALEACDGLTPELLTAGRAAQVRAARWRAEQRVAEAEVAKAGGNERKAARLRAEAREMWKQDYRRAFMGEDAPEF
jgi:hypothetical protein